MRTPCLSFKHHIEQSITFLESGNRPTAMQHKLQIGVIGSWRSNLPARSYALAEEVGKEVARRGWVLLTGGSTGIGDHAAKGCKEEGGVSVGIIPATDFRSYEYIGGHIDIKICTGTDDPGRVPTLINSCDGVIAIGGGTGTLAEITHAYLQGRPIVVLEGSGEVADKLHRMLDDGYLDSKRLVRVERKGGRREGRSRNRGRTQVRSRDWPRGRKKSLEREIAAI